MSKRKHIPMETSGPVGAGNYIQRQNEEPTPAPLPTIKKENLCDPVTFEGLGIYVIKLNSKAYTVRFQKETNYQFTTSEKEVIEKMDSMGFKRIEL